MRYVLSILALLATSTTAQAGIIADLLAARARVPAPGNAATADAAGVSNRGVQLTPNYPTDPGRSQVLVNADVGAERWSITLEASNDTILGNVFLTNGALPVFLWCQVTDIVGQLPNQTLGMDCFGADRCPPNDGQGGTCVTNQWQSLGRVELPASFFLP